MQDAINKQINAELYSGYLYLSMSAYYQSKNLPGFANWLYVQMQEEQAHAQIMYNHVVARGGRVILQHIAGPPTEWPDIGKPFADAYEHEKKVTRMMDDLVDLAMAEKDHASNAMLQWFVSEQVEEENNTCAITQQFQLVGTVPAGILMLDRELAARIFTPPAILTAGA